MIDINHHKKNECIIKIAGSKGSSRKEKKSKEFGFWIPADLGHRHVQCLPIGHRNFRSVRRINFPPFRLFKISRRKNETQELFVASGESLAL